MNPQANLLKVENLSKVYPARGGFFGKEQGFRAVNDVSFYIREGETLGLVGESGSGKSTIGRAVLMLDPPTSGRIELCGKDLGITNSRDHQWLRKNMQPVFQDPFASLNPRMRVGDFAAEPLEIHKVGDSRSDRAQLVAEAFKLVGLRPDFARRYPHELSGGQRQRVCIARAVALRPKLIVCDEPISALDVSIQAQVINLLMDLQESLGMAYLMISHDLSMVRHICHRVAVLHRGRVVELGDTKSVYDNPAHPYTRLLLSSVPRLKSAAKPRFDADTSRTELAAMGDNYKLTEIAQGHWAAVTPFNGR